MPVIGDAKVIVEAVDDTYERLHEGFAAQPGAVVDDDEQAVEFDFDLAVDDA
jgi:ATP adenylyltransferase